MEKQIEEIIDLMANEACPKHTSELCASGRCFKLWECPFNIHTIEILAKKGYRKVEQGEWIYHESIVTDDGLISGYSCSVCNALVNEEIFDTDEFHKNHCGNCGSKMKGN